MLFKVGPLTEQELGEVVCSFPRLRSLSEHLSLQTLLLRPFYLDLVTKSDNPLEVQELPRQVTEAWFLNWFWERVVRHPNRPDERERVLLTIAMRQLETHNTWVSSKDLNETAVRTLLSEDILRREEMEVRFAHDLYADWAKAKLIATQPKPLSALHQQTKYYLDLIKPLRLRALHFLEVKRDVKAWRDFVEEASQEVLPPAWRDAIIGALFHSPLLDEIVGLVEPELFDVTSPLLMHLLRIMRTGRTIPKASMQEALAQIPGTADQAQYQAHWRDPDIPAWLPILEATIRNATHIPANALLELARVCEMWVQTPHAPVRAEVCFLCLHILSRYQQSEQGTDEDGLTPSLSLSRAEVEEAQKYFVLALFAGIDCAPNEITQYIDANLSKTRRGVVEQLLLENVNWMPAARALPAFFVDVATRILCRDTRPLEDTEVSDTPFRRSLVRDTLLSTGGGTKNDSRWAGGAYDQGPFYYFLHMHPLHGLRLINTIVNHATYWWRLFQEQDDLHACTPLPQRVSWPDNRITELWGDERVYCWSSTGLCQSQAAVCALRALEKWLYDLQDVEKDITEYLSLALSGSSSLALAHVLINAFLRKPGTGWPALAPLLNSASIWVLEPHRLHARSLFSGWSFGNPFLERGVNEARFQELQRLAAMAHVKNHLLIGLINVFMPRANEGKALLSALLASLPVHTPVFTQEELQDAKLLETRREWLEWLSAWSDPTTWQVTKVQRDDGAGAVRYFVEPQWPETILAREQERQSREAALELPRRIWALKDWGHNLRDTGEVGLAFTREEAIAQIEHMNELTRVAQERGTEVDLHQAHAMIIAGLLIHHLDWLIAEKKVGWAIQQLSAFEPGEDLRDVSSHPFIRYAMGVDRSLAIAIPTAIVQAEQRAQPGRTRGKGKQGRGKRVEVSPYEKLIHALRQLMDHPHYEVRGYLFHSLRALWPSQPELIYECFTIATRQVVLSRRLDHPLPQDEWCHLSLLRLDAIDYYALTEVLELLPRGEDFARCKYTSPVRAFISELLLLTRAMTTEIEHRLDTGSLELHSYLTQWEKAFGRFLGQFALSLPLDVLETFLLPSLVERWLDQGNLFCAFLHSLVEVVAARTDHELDARFIWLWKGSTQGILHSQAVVNKSAYLFQTDVLAMLLFAEPLALSGLHTKLPLKSLTDVFEAWVTKLGHTVSGFKIVVRFLRKNGREYLADPGINWLLNSWEQLPYKQSILGDPQMVTLLAQLLHDIWYILPESQKEHIDFLMRFARIIDECAAVGNPLAVELQRKIQTL
jgi:hypothetical protein